MSRITSIDRAGRGCLKMIVQGCRDKRFSRAVHAGLLVHQRHSRLKTARLYDASRLEGLQDAAHGKSAHLPSNNPKFRLLFQPVYSHWANKIERLYNLRFYS